MERAVIKNILTDMNMSVEEKLEQIMRLNGADITREKESASQMKAELDEARAKNSAFADRDVIAAERDALKMENAQMEAQRRFERVSASKKFKNELTREGLMRIFTEAICRPENRARSDEDIMNALIKGHENEYFESPYSIRMTPANPHSHTPSEIDEIIASKYKNNPWIK